MMMLLEEENEEKDEKFWPVQFENQDQTHVEEDDDPISNRQYPEKMMVDTDESNMASLYDNLIVFGPEESCDTEIEVSEREKLAEQEAHEISVRESEVSRRKHQLHKMQDNTIEEDSTSENEEERRRDMSDLEHEIDNLSNGVRVPETEGRLQESSSSSASSPPPSHESTPSYDGPPQEKKEQHMEITVVEPGTVPLAATNWEPYFSERTLGPDERRSRFMKVYPGRIDARHAAIAVLLNAAGNRPTFKRREHQELAQKSQMLVTRAKNTDLLRTPKKNERACRNDLNCRLREYHGLIARECLNDEESLELERSGKLPLERRPCIGCMQYDVTWFFLHLRFKGKHAGNTFITSHYNPVNMKGEYCLEQCIMSSTYGLPLPVVPFLPGAMRLVECIMDGEMVTRFDQIGMIELNDKSDFP